jgi:hypothetical protein
VQADIRDQGQVLAGAALTLDLGQPVAVLMVSVLHLIPDSDDPHGLVRRVLASVARQRPAPRQDSRFTRR